VPLSEIDLLGDEDLADLYEHAPCGYVSLTPGGHIVKLNQTLAAGSADPRQKSWASASATA
jgi:hypothetical protein